MQADHLVKGEVAETKIISKLTEFGFLVSDTRGQAPYDLVVDLPDGGLKRVQVKSVRDKEYGIEVELCKSGWSTAGEYYKKEYGDDEVDAFAIYDHINDRIYWLWKDEAPTKKAQRSYDTWSEDLIDRKISRQ
jgi:hypothetical protein